MHVATDNGMLIEYEVFGDPTDPAVLLVMGFGTQLLGWDADFCRLLAARGLYVIRYDNRDCGLSTKLDEHPVDLMEFITAVMSGDVDRALAMAPYSLRDMARDGMDLLRALGIDRAHVVGSSMGGMIAQKMAIEFPERVLSLTSMMSSTGEQEYGQSTTEAQQVLFPATNRSRGIPGRSRTRTRLGVASVRRPGTAACSGRGQLRPLVLSGWRSAAAGRDDPRRLTSRRSSGA